MFELSVLNGLKTVGSFILYKDTLVFMIGPDNTGEKLGIMRLGGHIEENEIKRICSQKLRLRDFLENCGKLIQQKEIDYDMEMYAGVHLKF